MKAKIACIKGRVYVNTTPHDIVLRTPSGDDRVIPSSGVLINARAVEEPVGGLKEAFWCDAER